VLEHVVSLPISKPVPKVTRKRADLKFSMCVADICIQPPGTICPLNVKSPPTPNEETDRCLFIRPSIEILSHCDDKGTTEVQQLPMRLSPQTIKSSIKDTLKMRKNFTQNAEKVVSFEAKIKTKEVGETPELLVVPPVPKRRDFRKMQSEENNVLSKKRDKLGLPSLNLSQTTFPKTTSEGTKSSVDVRSQV
jgi:hypothetical protein